MMMNKRKVALVLSTLMAWSLVGNVCVYADQGVQVHVYESDEPVQLTLDTVSGSNGIIVQDYGNEVDITVNGNIDVDATGISSYQYVDGVQASAYEGSTVSVTTNGGIDVSAVASNDGSLTAYGIEASADDTSTATVVANRGIEVNASGNESVNAGGVRSDGALISVGGDVTVTSDSSAGGVSSFSGDVTVDGTVTVTANGSNGAGANGIFVSSTSEDPASISVDGDVTVIAASDASGVNLTSSSASANVEVGGNVTVSSTSNDEYLFTRGITVSTYGESGETNATVGGDVTVTSTGTGENRHADAMGVNVSAPSDDTVMIGGDLTVSSSGSGYVGAEGIYYDSDDGKTKNVDIQGDVTVNAIGELNGGAFGINSSSPNTGDASISIGGDLSATGTTSSTGMQLLGNGGTTTVTIGKSVTSTVVNTEGSGNNALNVYEDGGETSVVIGGDVNAVGGSASAISAHSSADGSTSISVAGDVNAVEGTSVFYTANTGGTTDVTVGGDANGSIVGFSGPTGEANLSVEGNVNGSIRIDADEDGTTTANVTGGINVSGQAPEYSSVTGVDITNGTGTTTLTADSLTVTNTAGSDGYATGLEVNPQDGSVSVVLNNGIAVENQAAEYSLAKGIASTGAYDNNNASVDVLLGGNVDVNSNGWSTGIDLSSGIKDINIDVDGNIAVSGNSAYGVDIYSGAGSSKVNADSVSVTASEGAGTGLYLRTENASATVAIDQNLDVTGQYGATGIESSSYQGGTVNVSVGGNVTANDGTGTAITAAADNGGSTTVEVGGDVDGIVRLVTYDEGSMEVNVGGTISASVGNDTLYSANGIEIWNESGNASVSAGAVDVINESDSSSTTRGVKVEPQSGTVNVQIEDGISVENLRSGYSETDGIDISTYMYSTDADVNVSVGGDIAVASDGHAKGIYVEGDETNSSIDIGGSVDVSGYRAYGVDISAGSGGQTSEINVGGDVRADGGRDALGIMAEAGSDDSYNITVNGDINVNNKNAEAPSTIMGINVFSQNEVNIQAEGSLNVSAPQNQEYNTIRGIEVGATIGKATISIGDTLTVDAVQNAIGIVGRVLDGGTVQVDIGKDVNVTGEGGSGITVQSFWYEEKGGTVDVSVGGNVKADTGIDITATQNTSADISVLGDVIAESVGLRVGGLGSTADSDILIEGTLSGGKQSVLFESNADSSKVALTTWKVELNENGNAAERADYFGNKADEAFEKSIMYIIKMEQPTEGGSFNVDGTADSHGFATAKEGEIVRIKANVSPGYEITGAFNGKSEKISLTKGEDGNYYIEVPKGGGVYLTISLAKSQTSKPGETPEITFTYDVPEVRPSEPTSQENSGDSQDVVQNPVPVSEVSYALAVVGAENVLSPYERSGLAALAPVDQLLAILRASIYFGVIPYTGHQMTPEIEAAAAKIGPGANLLFRLERLTINGIYSDWFTILVREARGLVKYAFRPHLDGHWEFYEVWVH